MAEHLLHDVKEQRNQEIARTIERIRAIEREQGVNRASLEEIKAALLELASNKSLFPFAGFPIGRRVNGVNPFYRLSEDEDHRFALYMAISQPEKKDVPPHDHKTWAVIVGIEGEEENRFYERTDDGSVPGRGELRQVGGDVVRPGTGVTLLPEDIHSIHVDSPGPTLHLHMYGIANEYRPDMVVYDMERGTVQPFAPHPNVQDVP